MKSDDDRLPMSGLGLGLAWLPYAIATLGLVVLALLSSRLPTTSGTLRGWLLIRAGVFAAIAVMSVLLADAATESDGLTVADQPIWTWLVHHRIGFLTPALIGITEVGSTVAMAALAAAVVVGLALRVDRRGDAIFVVVVAIGAGAAVAVLKPLIGRLRPPAAFRVVSSETSQSFPSGHALASASILGVLAVVSLPQINHRRKRAAVVVASVLLVALIGFSRMYLGVHWPTDVLGGWLIGAGWLILCLTVRGLRAEAGKPPM
jgi:membrane-associated phospholipid phosphatase